MKKDAVLIAFLAASILSVLSGGTAAAQDSHSTASAPSARDQSPTTGIKVHGHWTIDLRNPDGTLASHNEFENACVACGQIIGLILSRQAAVNLWQVQLRGFPEPCAYQGNPIFCSLAEVGAPVTPDLANFYFATLTLSTLGATFTLNGNFVATFDGQISEAQATAGLSTAVGTLQFSQRTLGTPIQVAAGQQVYVTVTFSFS